MIRVSLSVRRMTCPGTCLLWASLAAASSWGQVSFPTYPYILPAVAQSGGPVYVVPGTVTESTPFNLTAASGSVCLQGVPGGICTNAAGIEVAGSPSPGTFTTFAGTVGASSGKWSFGALLMSIEGVGTVQVFPSKPPNGLGSKTPSTKLTLTGATFGSLGFTFPSAGIDSPRITFLVADNEYSDNSGDFLLSLVSPLLEFQPWSTSKVMQLVGPCDWQFWESGKGPCNPTAASLGAPSQILGMGLGYSFPDLTHGKLIFLFGDTVGVEIPSGESLQTNDPACPAAAPSSPPPSPCFPNFHARDTIATAPDASTPLSLTLDFLQSKPGIDPLNHIPNSPLFVEPSPQPDGTVVDMGTDDIPNSGVNVNGENYIVVNTGHTSKDGQEFARSVLVDYAGSSAATEFVGGRTLSKANIRKLVCEGITCIQEVFQDGHFVFVSPHILPIAFAQQLGLSEPGVLFFGNGQYRAESIYLSYIPASQFWKGKDAMGNDTTMYFTGLDNAGRPTWSNNELCAVPVIYDNPTGLPKSSGCIVQEFSVPAQPVDPGTVGNVSVTYNSDLALWLMTWDGGRQQAPSSLIHVNGDYFSYAPAPWGPWSTPTLIYNECEFAAAPYHQGFGDFIRYVPGPDNPCPSVPLSGPAGPIIGTAGAPFTGTAPPKGGPGSSTAHSRRGGQFAPLQIESFATVNGGQLSIYFDLSTWNPYTVVLMQSNFTINPN